MHSRSCTRPQPTLAPIYHFKPRGFVAHCDFALCSTPSGVMEMLRRRGVSISGKQAAVVGRSNIVGVPMALMLLKQDASVCVVSREREARNRGEQRPNAAILVERGELAGLGRVKVQDPDRRGITSHQGSLAG